MRPVQGGCGSARVVAPALGRVRASVHTGGGVMRQRAMHSTGGTKAAQPLRRWLAVWLLLALCLAPLVARMHQVVHIPGAGLAPAVATAVPALPAVSPDGVGHTVQALFGHHGSLDCQALDQLAHGQAPLASFVWLPACWATTVSLAAPVHALASQRWWAPLARGPPGMDLPPGF